MSITIRNSGNAIATNSSGSFGVPSGTQEGDLLLAVFGYGGVGSNDADTPAGRESIWVDSSNRNRLIQRVADGTGGDSFTLNSGGGGTSLYGIMYAIGGGMVSGHNTLGEGSIGSSISFPTLSVQSELWIVFGIGSFSSAFTSISSLPAGYNNPIKPSNSSGSVSGGTGRKQEANVSESPGNMSFSATVSARRGILVGIKGDTSLGNKMMLMFT